jgi:hypothetical protein
LVTRPPLQALEVLNQRPASLLVKVLGLSGGPRAGAESAPAPGLLEVGVVGGGSGCEVGAQGAHAGEGGALLPNLQLPFDRLFEVTVADRDARIFVRLTQAGRAQTGGGGGGGGGGGVGVPRGPVWEATLAFADVLRTRTLSADLLLVAAGGGGGGARALGEVSVVCSARGMYTADQWGLLEWLGDGATDLPMLLRCGIRSLRDLEAMGLGDFLAAMKAGGLAAPVRARLAGRFHAAKAAGPGFLGAYGKALAARILRFYRRPGAASAQQCSRALQGTLEQPWGSQAFTGFTGDSGMGGRDRNRGPQDGSLMEAAESGDAH